MIIEIYLNNFLSTPPQKKVNLVDFSSDSIIKNRTAKFAVRFLPSRYFKCLLPQRKSRYKEFCSHNYKERRKQQISDDANNKQL